VGVVWRNLCFKFKLYWKWHRKSNY